MKTNIPVLQTLHEETIEKVKQLEEEGKHDLAKSELLCFIQTWNATMDHFQYKKDHLQSDTDRFLIKEAYEEAGLYPEI